VHGFDEFYGNLYHLNAEEEPEQPDYPKDRPIFEQLFAPRGVLDCKASDVDDNTEDPRFGRVGKQTIVDTGPLTRKRMETIEDDLLARTLGLIDWAHESDTPFFLWRRPRLHRRRRLALRSTPWSTRRDAGPASAVPRVGSHDDESADPRDPRAPSDRRRAGHVLGDVERALLLQVPPVAMTNCLNFGSPEEPGVMWQFSQAVRGLADGVAALGIPVTGGNVGFYNWSDLGSDSVEVQGLFTVSLEEVRSTSEGVLPGLFG
jgi:AIR synthase related protein, N-terminal domain